MNFFIIEKVFLLGSFSMQAKFHERCSRWQHISSQQQHETTGGGRQASDAS